MHRDHSVPVAKTPGPVPLGSPPRFGQVDVMKGVAILLVIVDHALPPLFLRGLANSLWERIAIPLFLVIMGFNTGRRGQRLRENQPLTPAGVHPVPPWKAFYSRAYFTGQLRRFVLPFLAYYLVVTLIGAVFSRIDGLHPLMLVGYPPYYGPGTWFIPLLLQGIVVLPVLCAAFQRRPRATILLCVVVELAMQAGCVLLFTVFPWAVAHQYVMFFQTSFLFYTSGVGIGLWLARDPRPGAKQNKILWVLFLASLGYLIAYTFFDYRTGVLRGDYHLLVIPYAAGIFMLGIHFLPRVPERRVTRLLAGLGKASYHIYLIQMTYFATMVALVGWHALLVVEEAPLLGVAYVVVSWVACSAAGWGLYRVQDHLQRRREVGREMKAGRESRAGKEEEERREKNLKEKG